MWPIALPAIQSIINNISSSTIGKTPNEITYGFTPPRPLDLLLALPFPAIATTRMEAADAISFAMSNQKIYYDRKHQPLFMMKGEWDILRLHKLYSIPGTLGMTKKLTQQYMSLFQIQSKVRWLAYKLKIPRDWKIHLIIWVAQFEPAPPSTKELFSHLYSTHLLPVLVDRETDLVKSLEVERLLNRRTTRQDCSNSVEYLVCWKSYSPK